VGRAFQRIDVRPAQQRPLKLEQPCCGNQRILHVKRQFRIFGFEGLMEHNLPFHSLI
jgi:hypothetical protein